MSAPSKALEAELVEWRKLLADLRADNLRTLEERRGDRPPRPTLTLIRGGRDA